MGAVLGQDRHVIAYASRSLNQAEQHYCVIQKECLAVVFALKQFRHPLPARLSIQTGYQPCSASMALRREDGVDALLFGTGNAGVFL